jgi:hypothetical protein
MNFYTEMFRTYYVSSTYHKYFSMPVFLIKHLLLLHCKEENIYSLFWLDAMAMNIVSVSSPMSIPQTRVLPLLAMEPRDTLYHLPTLSVVS